MEVVGMSARFRRQSSRQSFLTMLADLFSVAELKKSLNWRKLSITLGVDLLFVTILALLWYGYLSYSAGILNTEPGQFDDPALLLSFVQGIAYQFILVTLLAVLCTLLVSSCVKGWIYCYVTQKPYTRRFVGMLFLVKTGWFFLWIMLLFFLLTIQQELAFFWTMVYILLPLYISVTVILSTLLDAKNIKKSLSKSIHTLLKIHRFIIPVIIMGLVGLVLVIGVLALRALPERVWYACIALLLLAYLGWARLFFVEIVARVASGITTRITPSKKTIIKTKGIKTRYGSVSHKKAKEAA